MLNLAVFSEKSSFELKANRTDSSNIDDLKKTKTLRTLNDAFIFFSCRPENTSITLCRTPDH